MLARSCACSGLRHAKRARRWPLFDCVQRRRPKLRRSSRRPRVSSGRVSPRKPSSGPPRAPLPPSRLSTPRSPLHGRPSPPAHPTAAPTRGWCPAMRRSLRTRLCASRAPTRRKRRSPAATSRSLPQVQPRSWSASFGKDSVCDRPRAKPFFTFLCALLACLQ
jgi:hypothetical protein